MATACDVLGSLFGFVGSILLLISSWRSLPYKKALEAGKEIREGQLLAEEASVDMRNADLQLARVMSPEPYFIRAGAVCLAIGFFLSVLKYLFQ